jgi:lipoyl-dependent peroxiredoxin subunit D
MSESTEVIQEILQPLGLEATYRNAALTMLEEGESKYLRDFKLNFNGILTSDHLSPKEVALMGLCIAVNNINGPLTQFFKQRSTNEGATAEEIAEAVSVASLLSANNVLYRFRHFTQKEAYQKMGAKMRMQIMMKPVTGKPFFELMSLAVSAVNGCEQCVNSHEDSLIKLDVKEEKIWDAVRIATVITATGKVIY